MKQFITITVALASLIVLVSSSPTPNALPEAFELITRDEVTRILKARAENTLQKRTPGGVCASAHKFSKRGNLLTCVDSSLHRGELGWSMWLQSPAIGKPRGMRSIDQSLVCHSLSANHPDDNITHKMCSFQNIGSFGPDPGALCRVTT